MRNRLLDVMGVVSVITIVVVLLCGPWTIVSPYRGVVPTAPTPVTGLPVLGTHAIVLPSESGAVGRYNFHAPADYAIGVRLPSLSKLETEWGTPNATDFYFSEPVAGAHLYEISDDKSAVTLYGSDVGDVIANFGLVVYWCENGSVNTTDYCNRDGMRLAKNWWPNYFPEIKKPITWLTEPPIAMILTRNRAYGNVPAPTPAP